VDAVDKVKILPVRKLPFNDRFSSLPSSSEMLSGPLYGASSAVSLNRPAQDHWSCLYFSLSSVRRTWDHVYAEPRRFWRHGHPFQWGRLMGREWLFLALASLNMTQVMRQSPTRSTPGIRLRNRDSI
jgi:hypothetical protein